MLPVVVVVEGQNMYMCEHYMASEIVYCEATHRGE